jgi:hypothetical protein
MPVDRSRHGVSRLDEQMWRPSASGMRIESLWWSSNPVVSLGNGKLSATLPDAFLDLRQSRP